MKAICAFAGLGLLLSLVACSSGSSHTDSPTVTTIPLQSRPSGLDVAVDLADYVSDSKYADSALAFAVTSVEGPGFVPVSTASGTVTNYGSFSGTVYSNTFANMGLFTVNFTVTDPEGHASTASFQVNVDVGSALVFDDAGDLKYVDGGTGKIHDFSGSDGYTEAWQATLANGTIVFKRTIGTQSDLYAYIPTSGRLIEVAVDSQKSETYAGKTSDSQILYGKEDVGGLSLYLYDPATGRTQAISNNPVGDLSLVTVAANDEIYYIRPVGSETCIYHYSLSQGQETFVAETDQNYSGINIRAGLNNGDLVYTKNNSSGYDDLYYYSAGGTSYAISTGNTAGNAAYVNNTSLGHVLYTVNGATTLYLYNCVTRASTSLGTGSTYDTDMVSGDYVIYTTSGDAVTAYQISAASTTTIATATADYKGKLSDGKTLVYFKSTNLYKCDITSSASIASPTQLNSAGCTFDAVLSNDDVVYTESNALKVYDHSASAIVDVSTSDGNETYNADMGGGKFVFTTTGGSGNIYIWDGVAGSAATVTSNASADTYQGTGTYTRVLTTTTSSGTQTTTTYLTRTVRVVYFSRGTSYFTVRMVTSTTDTEVYDSATMVTTSTPGTPSTSTGAEVEAQQYIDDDVNSTNGDEVLKSVFSISN